MKKLSLLLAATAATSLLAQNFPPRDVPARSVPVPDDVSPQLRKMIGEPISTGNDTGGPKTAQDWKKMQANEDAGWSKEAQDEAKSLHLTIEPGQIAGVNVYYLKPETVVNRNKGRLLMSVHGGAYIVGSGLASTLDGLPLAAISGIETVCVDYRMPPDAPFPAAVDDAVAVWKELIKTHNPRSMGLFGTSAGGGLTLATALKLKSLHLPLPGGLFAGTPWADLTKTGDSEFTNEYIDNVLVKYQGGLEADAKLYAGTHDLKEPLISPVYGDLSGFPPVVLVSGTRDLFLSDTVRVHQKLLQAGVDAQLLVLEGQSHANYLSTDVPESKAAIQEVAEFLDRHLDR